MLTYCFESSHVPRTLAGCRKNDLAVVDTEGHEKAVREAVSRGVYVYGYLNVGAVESGRSYYENFHHIRLAKYAGWDGEYWINPTTKEWQDHCIALAKQIKATGAIGLYLDNTDIYYMCQQGFKEEKTKMLRSAPSAQVVYTALANIILKINALGLIVMPNGGDTFVRKFISAQYNKKSNYHTQAPRMRSKMVESCKRDGLPGLQYIERGWITQDEYDTLCELYEPYVKLGGNGSGTKIMKEVEKLPIKGGLK